MRGKTYKKPDRVRISAPDDRNLFRVRLEFLERSPAEFVEFEISAAEMELLASEMARLSKLHTRAARGRPKLYLVPKAIPDEDKP
jgi:hypothetical protein